jgi:tRNA-dihydrouridine synthase B
MTISMTNQDRASQPFFYLAPIQGVTDALFRNIFDQHFGGFDAAMAPFINPQRHCTAHEKRLADILPENNPRLPIIPQLLNTDADDFLVLADRMHDLGYTHINWNLGCPVPMVARKKRGSGILPYPEMIVDLLEKIMPRLKMELSIKTRLGYLDSTEILTLLPRLDVFPLKEIIIHARLGQQLYTGGVDLDGFALCRQHSRHELVYNGDINDMTVFQKLRIQFPWVKRWMIGRGILADPLLILSLRGKIQPTSERMKMLREFHDDLFRGYRQRFSGPGHLLGRMKQLWLYLIASFPDQQKALKKIKKARTEAQYLAASEEIFDGCDQILLPTPGSRE